MAIHRLPATFLNLPPGLHSDGGNLYLQVNDGAAGAINRSWIFRYHSYVLGRETDMGLGSCDTVSLATARELARKYRELRLAGHDPRAHREAERAANIERSRPAKTFDQVAAEFIKAKAPGWTSIRHADQWRASLARYASPTIGRSDIATLDTAAIMRVLNPIWLSKPVTAKRVRARLEAVVGYAETAGYRPAGSPNPARWAHHLQNLLAKPTKVVSHMTALPHAQVPAFLVELRKRSSMAALALRFLILTAVRTADVRHARLADIDLVGKVWKIPRLSKVGTPHTVPLSTEALEVIALAGKLEQSEELLFPGEGGGPLGANVILETIKSMGYAEKTTAHGFRSSFRDWGLEISPYPHELCEMSLGHAVGDATTRAYARSDGLEKRRAIMESWAAYISAPRGATVVPIRKRRPI